MKRLLFLLSFFLSALTSVKAQVSDSAERTTILKVVRDSASNNSTNPLGTILKKNLLIHAESKPVPSLQQNRNHDSKDWLFYQIMLLLIYLGLLKTTFNKYFINMVRVFFNTSLRQSQLTDQLLIAKLPSLLFNIFFILSFGYYLFFVLIYNNNFDYSNISLLICIAIVMGTYLVKNIVLKFTGWLTGYKKEADDYNFIVFLVNKILGLLMVPFVVIIPFAEKNIVSWVLIVSYCTVALMFMFRYLRSYEVLQYRLKASRRHFLLYIFGIELMPLLLIYKLVTLFVNKNL